MAKARRQSHRSPLWIHWTSCLMAPRVGFVMPLEASRNRHYAQSGYELATQLLANDLAAQCGYHEGAAWHVSGRAVITTFNHVWHWKKVRSCKGTTIWVSPTDNLPRQSRLDHLAEEVHRVALSETYNTIRAFTI